MLHTLLMKMKYKVCNKPGDQWRQGRHKALNEMEVYKFIKVSNQIIKFWKENLYRKEAKYFILKNQLRVRLSTKTSWLKPSHYNMTSFQSSLLRILREPWKLDPSYSPSCIQCVWGEGEGCQVPPIMGNQSEDKVVPFIRQRGSCHAGWKISIK